LRSARRAGHRSGGRASGTVPAGGHDGVPDAGAQRRGTRRQDPVRGSQQLHRLAKAALRTEFLRLAPIVTLQPQYNLLARDIEWEIIPVCRNERIGVLPWSPLGGGWLTGKYRRDAEPQGATRLGEDPDRGVEARRLRNTGRTWRIVDEVRAVAEGRGDLSMAVVALSWLVDRPAVTSVILGARTLEQLEDTLRAADCTSTRRRPPGWTRSAPPWPPSTRTGRGASSSEVATSRDGGAAASPGDGPPAPLACRGRPPVADSG
jgi:hypothetical protein